ncbi:MAG TPA: hypothetical protein VGM37_06695 [Armatimonadota bacterium]|jgi:hypothetical protein
MMIRCSRLIVTAAATAIALSLPVFAGPAGPRGPGGPGGAPTITALSVAKLSGAFTLIEASSTKSGDFVTKAKYTAKDVTITVTPSDASATATILTGSVTITTETTADASGNGVVTGTLTFVSGTNNGIVAQLSGLVGSVNSPLLVSGTLQLPATTSSAMSKLDKGAKPAKPAAVQVAALLSTDESLAATLTGYAATAAVGAPTTN